VTSEQTAVLPVEPVVPLLDVVPDTMRRPTPPRTVLPLDFAEVRANQAAVIAGAAKATEMLNAHEEIARLRTQLEEQRQGYERRFHDVEHTAQQRCDQVEDMLRLERERYEGMVAKIAKDFTAERERYFASAEEQVVRLSLSIAERILHREMKIDQLFLRTAVRVALESLPSESACTLHVATEDESAWRKVFAQEPRTGLRIVADPQLERGDCRIGTDCGVLDLRPAVQIAETEASFFDLLRQRPAR
jgi:flagellar assembly protein FliH